MPSKCTVTGTLQALSGGTLAQGMIIFELSNIGTGNPVVVTGTSIIPRLKYTVFSAADGTFTQALWGNDVISPANTIYLVTYRDACGNEVGPIQYSLTGSSVDLDSAAPVNNVLPPVFAANVSVLTLLNQQGPLTAVTGTGADATLYTFALPANTLAAGQGFRITAYWNHSTGSASTTYKLKLGASTLLSVANADTSAGSRTILELFNNAAVTNAQHWSATTVLGGSPDSTQTATGTSAVDMTASSSLTLTFSVAATDQVTPKLWLIEIINGPPTTPSGVTSLNTLKGDVTLAAGSNVTLVPAGNTITIDAAGGSGGNPGGTNTQIQYNNASSFGGFGAWDGTTLGIPGNANLTTAASTYKIAGDPVVGYPLSDNRSIFAGRGALSSPSYAGNFDTAVGYLALQANTTGDNNTAVGPLALNANTTGEANTAMGSQSMFLNVSGSNNTAYGDGSLPSNVSGVQNTAVGNNSLLASGGNLNIGIGFYAGQGIASGSSNIIIGTDAGASGFSGAATSNISIGNDPTLTGLSATGSNQLYVGGVIYGTGLDVPATSVIGTAGNLIVGVLVTKYNGIATVSNGVPAEYAKADWSAQTAAIGSQTLYAVPVAAGGQYRLSWNAKVTTVATTSSTLGPLTVGYTDQDGVAQTITCGAQTSAGAIATTSAGNTTTSVLLGLPMMLNCKGSTNITYTFGYASNNTNQMVFALHMKLEAL